MGTTANLNRKRAQGAEGPKKASTSKEKRPVCLPSYMDNDEDTFEDNHQIRAKMLKIKNAEEQQKRALEEKENEEKPDISLKIKE